MTNRRGRKRQGVHSSLEVQKSVRWDGMDPTVMRDLANDTARAFYHLWGFMVIGRGSWWLEKANIIIFMDGGLGELQDGLPKVSPWEGYGTNPHGRHFKAHEGHSDRNSQHGFSKGILCLPTRLLELAAHRGVVESSSLKIFKLIWASPWTTWI